MIKNNQMIKKKTIPSVNFHLLEPCNMNCNFCFATFKDVKSSILPKGYLPKAESLEIVRQLAKFGFKKITFAGGEPTLSPWLPELIKLAKELGMTTMIISNGSKLTNEFLAQNKEHLDWIGISIDSLEYNANVKIGRIMSNTRPLTKEYYYSLINRINTYGYKLKLNTVVNKFNYQENFVELMQTAKPERWKVMQVLPIVGQNDGKVEEFLITGNEFEIFLNNHSEVKSLVPEDNSQMIATYAMIDPSGRFFDNVSSKHKYSSPILENGVDIAYESMRYDYGKFIERGGIYDAISNIEVA